MDIKGTSDDMYASGVRILAALGDVESIGDRVWWARERRTRTDLRHLKRRKARRVKRDMAAARVWIRDTLRSLPGRDHRDALAPDRLVFGVDLAAGQDRTAIMAMDVNGRFIDVDAVMRDDLDVESCLKTARSFRDRLGVARDTKEPAGICGCGKELHVLRNPAGERGVTHLSVEDDEWHCAFYASIVVTPVRGPAS